jgi:hypothetical protein
MSKEFYYNVYHSSNNIKVGVVKFVDLKKNTGWRFQPTLVAGQQRSRKLHNTPEEAIKNRGDYYLCFFLERNKNNT